MCMCLKCIYNCVSLWYVTDKTIDVSVAVVFVNKRMHICMYAYGCI